MIFLIFLSLLIGSESNINKERRNLRTIRADLKKNRQKLARLKQEETSILIIIDGYDHNRELTEEYINRLDIQSKNLVTEIETLSSRIEYLDKIIAKHRTEVKKELLRLYIWRRFYKLDVVLSAKSIPEVYQTSWNLRLISRLGKRKINEYQALINESVSTREEKKDLLFELAELKKDKEEELSQLRETIAEKKDLLASVRQEKGKNIQLTKELKLAQGKLEKLIEDLIAKSKIIKRVAAIPKNMTWPCNGKVISKFGRVRHPKYNTTTKNNGIDIKAERGSPVYTVSSGRVSYSGRFLGYGNIILIEHDNGLYSLYGHLELIMVHLGDHVDKGEQIGTVGETGSLAGPMLHFELRKGGKPINPLTWLK